MTLESIQKNYKNFVTHLECGLDGDTYEAGVVHGLSKAGRPLLVKYDLEAVKNSVSKADLLSRPVDMWRFRELLPVTKTENIVSLGETVTPLLNCPNLESEIGSAKGSILIKDEGRLPTGSFKARGIGMAV
ncbi:MAG: threonine synthase, partial [Sphingomonadales bacterium]|nr:threonine synthase [Sphingomonadales bacterium]